MISLYEWWKTHSHWQNLSTTHIDKKLHRRVFPYHGRRWINFNIFEICLGWCIGRIDFTISYYRDCEEGLYRLMIQLPLLSIWCSVSDGYDIKADRRRTYIQTHLSKLQSKEISFQIFEEFIWWRLWLHPDEYYESYWRRGSIDWKELLLGPVTYHRSDIETRNLVIPFPEKTYHGKVCFFESRWSRPRWFVKRLLRLDIEIEEGIPHQGRGTASWNCGESRTYSACFPAKTIEEGVGKFIGSVLHTRVTYGGWNDWEYNHSNEQ